MQSAGAITQDASARRKPASGQKAAAIYFMWGFLLAFRGFVDLKLRSFHPSQAYFLLGVCLPILLGAVGCLLGLFALFGMKLVGSADYEEIADLGIEQRARDRFDIEVQQLNSLGFSYVFTSGEAMSLLRILLIFPAIVYLQMWMKGEVLVLRGGKLLLAVPVFCSSDGRAFAHPNALGTTFHTAFRSGQVLITKNYKSVCDSCEGPDVVMHASVGTIPGAWQIHKEWLDKLETAANPATRDRSYQAYTDVTHREDSFIKSQR